MFNSVEFVLMFLSIFSSVTQENIKAVMFLLGLAFQYDAMDLWTAMKEHGLYDQVMTMIEPLSALAECSGYDMSGMDKDDLTLKEVYEMLRAIMNPIMGQLGLAEMEQIRYTAMSGGEVLELPPARLEALVQNWTRHARDDDEKYGRFGKLVAATNAGCASGSGSKGKRQMPGPNEAVKEGPDHRPKDEKLEAWGKMRMDDRTAATIVAYCKQYAAASAEATVTRTGRVKKRQLAGWNHAFYATPGWPQGWGVQPTREELKASESSSTDSSGMCIGFSASGRTQIVCTKAEKGHGRRKWSEGASVDNRSNMEYGAERSGLAGDRARGHNEMDMRAELDAKRYGEYTSQVDDDDESVDKSETGSNDGSGSVYSYTSEDVNNKSLSKSASWDTLDIRMYCPPLVGYYMRQEEYRTQNPQPRPAPNQSGIPPRPPIPGMTFEEIYGGYANSWDTEQNWLWRRALNDPARQYENEAFPELDPEPEAEPKLECKSAVVGKIVAVVGLKLGGLFKH